MSEGKEPLTNNQLAELSLYKHLNTTRKKNAASICTVWEDVFMLQLYASVRLVNVLHLLLVEVSLIKTVVEDRVSQTDWLIKNVVMFCIS